jgi:hypothetical protein
VKRLLAAVSLLATSLAHAQVADVPYVVEPPPGMFPWPHQRPDMSHDEHARLMSELFVINNFGEYQFSSGGDPKSAYLHDGIDVVMPNGTMIHAVAPGTVRAIIGSAPHYMTIVIEDRDQPRWAWTYTHLYDFKIKVGDRVGRGTPIASVNFIRPGVDHIHLGRAWLKEHGSWETFGSLAHVNPEKLFPFLDAEPPRIQQPFRYARNESFDLFPPGAPTVVSGDVDVIAGIRDDGLNSRSKGIVVTTRGYTGVLGVSRLELEVKQGRRTVWSQASFDFDKLALDYRGGGLRDWQRVATVYYPHDVLQPPPANAATMVYFYVVTNGDGDAPLGTLERSLSPRAWCTTDFPNGTYTVIVRAWDTAGNMAEAAEQVEVAN